MKKGLELLRVRAYNEKPDLRYLEKYGIFLPPIYTIFFTYYKTGDFLEIFNLEKGNVKMGGALFLSSIQTHNDIEIFDTLFDMNRLISNNGTEVSDYLRIGYIGNEILLVGINTENKDKIFRHRFNDRTPNDPSYIKMAEDVFEYIQSFYECEINQEKEKLSYFRNWGEDFWRIKE